MTTRRTIVWIAVTVLGLGILCLIAVAGAGIYFVTQHIQTERRTSADAMGAFEAVRQNFPGARPLYELDNSERPRAVRSLADMPTSAEKPRSLAILAWTPDDERLVRVSLPFWMLRIGPHKVDIDRADGFNLESLQLDVPELERIGPTLLYDFRNTDGVRVLVWTQ